MRFPVANAKSVSVWPRRKLTCLEATSLRAFSRGQRLHGIDDGMVIAESAVACGFCHLGNFVQEVTPT